MKKILKKLFGQEEPTTGNPQPKIMEEVMSARIETEQERHDRERSEKIKKEEQGRH